MLDREFWVGTEKHPLGKEREGKRWGWGRGEGVRKKFPLQSLLYKSLTTKQPNKKDISKQHSKQVKKGEIERSYKMFANSVFRNSGRYNS